MKLASLVILGISGCLSSGCMTTWQTTDGTVTMTWRPAIIFRTDTAILFNDGNEPLIQASTGFAAEGASKDATDENP